MYIISYTACDSIYSIALKVAMDRNKQMERSMEDMRRENRNIINIGPEMDQEVEDKVKID